MVWQSYRPADTSAVVIVGLILLVVIKFLHARDLRRASGGVEESESQIDAAEAVEAEGKIKGEAGSSPRQAVAQL